MSLHAYVDDVQTCISECLHVDRHPSIKPNIMNVITAGIRQAAVMPTSQHQDKSSHLHHRQRQTKTSTTTTRVKRSWKHDGSY